MVSLGFKTQANLDYNVFITEVLPNPEGSDAEGEFLELYNAGDEPVDLADFEIDDAEAGSRLYEIPEGTVINSGEHLVFYREETGLAFNNTYDSARLIDPFGEVVSQVDYDEVKEGASYALGDDGVWRWTTTPTPGEENIITIAEDSSSKKSTTKSSNQSNGLIPATLDNIRDFDDGDRVKVQGTVAVEPGVLGSQFFYIIGSPGIQVYSYKKAFPAGLTCGDIVQVAGTLAESRSERRISVGTGDLIVKVGQGNEPEAHELKNSEVSEPAEGQLVTVSGELIEIKGSSLYLDDGTDEIKVYIKQSTGIKKSGMKEGTKLIVTGIVSQYDDEYRILPRYQDDIKIEQSQLDSGEQVITIPQGKSLAGVDKYIWVLNGALVILLGGIFWRKRKSTW
ncbi:lamin tail domain-containing protein [Patescibacteria group bacterium]|nr:lamin tail domain-containing protein [Patescibacteria group bacterium]MBU4512093.1 lamin tail domain-containing protein [Patescibacteria group bacterium]